MSTEKRHFWIGTAIVIAAFVTLGPAGLVILYLIK